MAAGKVRGRAPMIHFFHPRLEGFIGEVMSLVSHESYARCVNELVCLDMANSQMFVDRLSRAWDNDDAVFPLDQRLPLPARQQILNIVKPTIMATNDGDVRVDGMPVEPGDAVVVATSGTSGTSKAAVLTMSAVEASARATTERLNVSLRDTWLACLPPSHVGGLSVITRSLIMGTSLIAAPSFSPETFTEAAQNGATLVSLVSTALQRIDPALYRTIVLGGSRQASQLPPNCVTTYGMTETGSGVVYNGTALRGVELEIRDSIVYVKAPMLLRAYRDGSVPLDSNGWFCTNDRGSLSDDGVLQIEGRDGDLIITGGENVWPEVVEDALRNFQTVTDLCVAGVPDPEWGHAVHIWVVTTDKHELSLDALRAHVKQTLPAHFAPRQMHVVSEIPRTALGTPQRSLLVESLKSS
jgi:O-succinylbenzoic acid--CoA ligase